MSEQILLLGASGYIGSAFVRELEWRGSSFVSFSRKELDYTNFETLRKFLNISRPSLVINCAGYTGKPNVDACESSKYETFEGNTILPITITNACLDCGIPWGHVSSGCIYNGSKNGAGFTEGDRPNFCFGISPCSWYSGTKSMAEDSISKNGNGFIWRLRIPFDEFDGPRNYLSKIQRYPKVYDNTNSISHRGDFAAACLDLWKLRAPFGTYNVTNPGHVTTRQVVSLIEKHLKPDRKFEFWESDEEFYRVAAKTPRSNCILDVSKLLATGVNMRPVKEALEYSLKNWRPE